MGEIVPVFLGFVVGLIGSRIPVTRVRYIAMAVLAIICGVADSYVPAPELQAIRSAATADALLSTVAAAGQPWRCR